MQRLAQQIGGMQRRDGADRPRAGLVGEPAAARLHDAVGEAEQGLARRAAEAYDPEARSFLAEVYYLIFECEMRQNRPIAARAALRLVTRFAPAEDEFRNSVGAF